MTPLPNRQVKPILRSDCEEYVLNIHYAKRWPSISYAFGLFYGASLHGVVTYGSPPSSSLRRGIAGAEYADNVLELNRLCLKNNGKNEASFLIGNSLKKLPKPSIIVSFADTAMEHSGKVYQATNFLYTGLSAKRTDWKLKGKEHLHGQTVADEFRGHKNRSALMKEKYGTDFYLAPRSRKHRYVYLLGDKWFRRKLMKILKYPVMTYPT